MSEKNVVLITGVSSGIGKATAEFLSKQGFRVFGTMRKPHETDSRSADVELVQLDVREDASVRSCVQKVLDRAGRIDALVNNAGYALIGSLEETGLAEARNLFETNFFGVLRLNLTVLPQMRKQGNGRIVNVGSVAGFVPMPYQGIYAAAKHALKGYSESLDHEVRQFGIRVSVIEPGFVRTRMAQNAEVASQTLGAYSIDRDRVIDIVRESTFRGEDPEKVAAVILRALTSNSPRRRYLVGHQAKLTSMLRKFVPEELFEIGLRRQFGLTRI